MSPANRSKDLGLRAVFLALLLAFVGFQLFSSIGDITYFRGSDEGYYLRYTETVASEGPAGFRTNFDAYLGDDSQWKFPNPFRIGFFGAAALWTKAFGASFESLSSFSATSHLLLILLAYVFARRHFGAGKGELIAIAIATSPLLLGLGRRALMDSFATLTAALAICSFVDALWSDESRRASKWWRFGLAFAFAILVKETTILLLGPFAVAAWFARRRAPRAFLPLLVAPAVCALVYVVAAGGVAPVLELVDIIVNSPETNQYAQRWGSGPWYRYVVDFLLMSPWPPLLCLAALGALLARSRVDTVEPRIAFFALVLVMLIAEYALFTKNLRYVAVLELPIRILAVHFLWSLTAARGRVQWIALCVALVLWNSGSELATFDAFFVQNEVYDPVSRMLLRFREFIPR